MDLKNSLNQSMELETGSP